MAVGESLLREWLAPRFCSRNQRLRGQSFQSVALQQGLKKDFGCTFISVSSGSLEQALSRDTHRCSWLGDSSSAQTASPCT